MTGTIVKLRLSNGYDDRDLKGKPITTIKLDTKMESEFDIVGEIGRLGDKVEITATLVQ